MVVVDVASVTAAVASLLVLVLLFTRVLAHQLEGYLVSHLTAMEKSLERMDSVLRDEMARSRDETQRQFKMVRDDMAQWFSSFSQTFLGTLQETTRDQSAHQQQFYQSVFEAWRDFRDAQLARVESLGQELTATLDNHYHHTTRTISEMALQHKGLLDTFSRQLKDLTVINEQKLTQVRSTLEDKLTAIQQGNQAKLDEMRQVVDEKLHQTLEQRLGESFKLVSDRLELVHKGLGEMQSLATGVGDLKKVLTNVKTRGTLGEVQLDNILEQIFSPDQYRKKAQVKPGSQERVDFAVVLPGRDDETQSVLLPIDAKFPLEDYQRLQDAEDSGDLAGALEAAKLLESRIRQEAKSIADKYINPPTTTDFAILFLPLEGLLAEVLRRPGLWDSLQRDHRVVVTGPTTITALLNSLSLGFRTLAIQKRTSEVWTLLGAVKTEFHKFGDVLEKTQKKLQEAAHSIDSATTRTRAIERKLRTVEALSSDEAPKVLGDLESLSPEDDNLSARPVR